MPRTAVLLCPVIIYAACACSDVSLVKQISHDKCILNSSFGCNANSSNMWINKGCRGEFACDGKKISCSSNSMTVPNDCPCSSPPPANVFALSMGNHMVIQHDAPVAFGTVAPGASVSVQLDGMAVGTATATATGAWSLSLAAQQPSANEHNISAASGNRTQVLSGVLFGEVSMR